MMKTADAILDSIEEKYHRLMAEVKEKQAEAKIADEKASFERAWEDFKADTEAKSEQAKSKLINAWNSLESKTKEITK